MTAAQDRTGGRPVVPPRGALRPLRLAEVRVTDDCRATRQRVDGGAVTVTITEVGQGTGTPPAGAPWELGLRVSRWATGATLSAPGGCRTATPGAVAVRHPFRPGDEPRADVHRRAVPTAHRCDGGRTPVRKKHPVRAAAGALTAGPLFEVIARNKGVPTRTGLADNRYSSADPRIVMINSLMTRGRTPYARDCNASCHHPQSPWLRTVRGALFGADPTAAPRDGGAANTRSPQQG